MAEGFDFQPGVYLAADLGDFRKRAFPCQHHSGGTQVIPGLGALVIGNGLLGGDMALTVGGVFASQSEGTQVCDDQRIHPGVVQLLQIGGQKGDFIVARHDVHGNMGFDTMVVGEFYGLGQFFRGEVSGKGTHTEVGTGQVYSIRAVENGHLQPFHISGGAE